MNENKLILLLSLLIVFTLHSNGYNQYSNNFDRFSLSLSTINLVNKLSASNKYPKIDCQLLPISNQKSISATTKNRRIHRERLVLSGIGLVGLNIAAYQPFKQTWWDEERTNFHFYHGWRRTKGNYDFLWGDSYSGHMDKLGHYYSARIISEQLSYLSRWIGFSNKTSEWVGPLMSSIFLLEIEIYDGFFKEWGFSLADFAANELGAFAPMLLKKIPYSRNFQLKFSYHPSNEPNTEPTFIKDYAGMTFWLSWDYGSLLPKTLKSWHPEWLNIALGYSVSKYAHGDIEVYLAPDINWEKVPICKSDTAQFIKKVLNYFHFPCITWKLHPKSKFYALYF
jgi:hypothetical protein